MVSFTAIRDQERGNNDRADIANQNKYAFVKNKLADNRDNPLIPDG
jgi:hypothetical protein